MADKLKIFKARAEDRGKTAMLRTTVRSMWGGPRAKRFFKEVTVKEVQLADARTGHGIHLDGRPLRTPAKRVLAPPSRALALAIAREWDAQEKVIMPHLMPLMTLATTAVDQIPNIRDQLEDGMLQYLASDTVCFRSPDDDDARLKRLEVAHWDPALAWFNRRFQTSLVPTDGLDLQVSHADLEAVEAFLDAQSDEAIAALDMLTISCKSFVLAAAVTEGHLSAEDACKAARVSEDAQIEEWGLAEGVHDLDVEDLRMRVGAASVFVKLSASPDVVALRQLG
jgi:ATP synthase F1 complex assembly factor 2